MDKFAYGAGGRNDARLPISAGQSPVEKPILILIPELRNGTRARSLSNGKNS